MKILLFTHKSDIDGMGNAVLSKLAFSDVEYVLCETFNLQKEISKYYEDGRIYDFDMIYITDMWLKEPMFSKITTDIKLKDKFYIFDHHKSAATQYSSNYPFVTIKISNEYGLCCGTSLFYEYLTNNGFIDINNNAIKEFVELTRKYDTWEWKNLYNEEMPHELSLLFDAVGCSGYIELMYQKLLQKNNVNFNFNEFERMLIENKINQVHEKVSNYAKKVYYEEILGYKAGIVFIDYEYRNDLTEYFRENGFDMDFVMLIALDYGSISYRNIKEDINVRLIAESMGGKGHDKAASSPIDNALQQELINIIIKRKQQGDM